MTIAALVTYFKYVFFPDVSQTHGAELPSCPEAFSVFATSPMTRVIYGWGITTSSHSMTPIRSF